MLPTLVESEIRSLVERLVADVHELLRVKFLRGFGLDPEAAASVPRTATNKPRMTGRAAQVSAKAKTKARTPRATPKTEPASQAELIDSPELPAEARVVALVANNTRWSINSGTVANTLGIEPSEARSLIAKLVRSSKLLIVGDRNGLPRIVLGPSG